MKKIFILALITIATLASSITASAQDVTISASGDSIIIQENGKTIVAPNAKAIVEAVKSSLNDTVISNVAADSEDSDFSSDADNERQRYYNYRQSISTQQTEVVITCVVFGSIIFIIFLCLVFFYMHRRAKYRMIEKAIENNYELPASVAGLYPRNLQQPTPPQPIIINQQQPGNGQPQQPGANQMPPFRQMEAAQTYDYSKIGSGILMPGQYNIQGFKGSIIWAAVGICLILFFGSAGFKPIVALSAIPLIVGIVKFIDEFFKQRSRIEYERYQMQQGINPFASQEPVMGTPMEQPAAEQPAQPTAPQPSGEVTPPPFGGPQQ